MAHVGEGVDNTALNEFTTLGTITIFDRHSIVEVPADSADDILRAMAKATVKGKKILMRRDREG